MWLLVSFSLLLLLAISLLSWLLGRNPIHKGDRVGAVRPPIEQILTEEPAKPYSMKGFKAPFVSGRLFRFMVWLSYTRLGYVLLVKGNMKKSKLDLFRGEYIPERPTYKPTEQISLPAPAPSQEGTKINLEQYFLRIYRPKNKNDSPSSKFIRPGIIDFYLAYKSGVCTPLDVVRSVLDAIKDSNKRSPPLRAIIESHETVVMEMAEASTSRWSKGEPLSLMDGVPIAVKGEMLVEPYSFLCGGTFKMAAMEGVTEGPNIRNMRGCGAVIIGIANMQEFGKGTLGSNPHQYYQTPRNPYDTTRYCGGSSSGAAASVSSGMCPLALGGDGGGSIRIPSTLCGIVGLKPTYEYLSSNGGTALGYTVGVHGPIGTSCIDMAIAINIMEEGKRYITLDQLHNHDLTDIKVGVYWDYFNHAHKCVVNSCRNAVKKLEELGAQIKEVYIPELDECRLAHMLITLAEGASSMACEIDKHFWDFNLETLTPLLVGLHISGIDYINALKQRTRSIKILQSLFKQVDIIVTPGTACTAPVIPPSSISHGSSDVKTSGDLMRFSFLANLTGIPGLVVPVGRGEGGLPVSLQLLGPWYSEGLLLKIGRALECSFSEEPPLGRPDVYYDILTIN